MTRKPNNPPESAPRRSADDDLADFPVTHPTTGTVDDEDDPSDEQPDENEAEVGETQERTEAPEEFQRDDEDA
jgi:hypothetical protein